MITFSYPTVTPTTTLNLRNPELGNSDLGDRGLIYRKTMSGDLHTNTTQHRSDRKMLSFHLLSSTTVASLISFMKTVRHNQFTYIDHEGTSHTCKFPISNIIMSGAWRHGKTTQIELEVIS